MAVTRRWSIRSCFGSAARKLRRIQADPISRGNACHARSPKPSLMDKRMARPAVGPGRSAATRQPRDRNDVGGVMSYRVGFYREIVNSYGTPFKASVYTAELETLGSMDEAITIAIDRFKRDREIGRAH